VPVKVGLAIGALVATALSTKAVVAICVVLVPAVAVGAAGTPVKVGDAKIVPVAVATKAVVAICVVFIPAVAVGAAGIPVNTGEFIAAYSDESILALANP
jgi:hypothetical protein